MTDYRATLHQLMTATLEDEALYHDWIYNQFRPRYMPKRPWHKGLPVQGDCSKGVQFLCWWAEVPVADDPMGQNYGPFGNSSTLWAHLVHVDDPRHLEVGDIVTFGFNGDEHATMVYEADPVNGNPLLWSFGHQGAPNTYRLSQDGRPAQYRKLDVPAPPLTPIEKLRASTGWFAWVAWRLGEGAWRRYGKRNAKVRPNVPKVIPPSWWKRYAQFLLNRKKGNKPTTKG